MISSPAGEAAAGLPETGYAALFDAHFWGLVRFARLLGADDPEDVAQEAFVRLHRRRRALRDPNAALAYLRSTVCNLTRNRLRHLGVARRRRAQLAETGTEASAEAGAVHRESVRELLAALDLLPRRQREVLVLRYWLDLGERETADTLGVGVGTVKTHTSRAIAALGRTLRETS
ncbi:sigma-70 family RNA polymerase sigma factor [Actinomadura macrotermitis]|uniref:RNA polymerase sigma-E factor n=1 Tax=Actinomadura macrotermitis TaxID=2585200 RepID=A0A7K0C558_9ACTN|nr:sigma-70 family RNA polymerase sigma factor [Actinomadura macrotermitis]MQY08496.1 RNA polymerase sigma-E factor [Actinomadura macrotermitis]